jgi:hypothetical protein
VPKPVGSVKREKKEKGEETQYAHRWAGLKHSVGVHLTVGVLRLFSLFLFWILSIFWLFTSPEHEFFSIFFLMIPDTLQLSEEAKARLEAMQQAIANCRIEGMQLRPDNLAYLEELMADDSLTDDQRLKRMFAHIVSNPTDARQSHTARS